MREEEMNLTLMEKGKLALIKHQEEVDDKQIAKDKEIFEQLVKTANDRFGGEFAWTQSKQEDYYIITNLEERFALGSLNAGSLQYVKKCKECGELINSVEVYLHNLHLVNDGTIKFYHTCVEKQSSPEDVLLSALEDYVVNICENYTH